MPKVTWDYARIPVIVLSAGIFFIFASLYLIPGVCSTQECFIERANNCETATLTTGMSALTMRFTTQDCQLSKQVMHVHSSEPVEIKNAFLGSSMECSYERFNTEHFSKLTTDLDSCDGPLKDAIEQLT